MIKTTFDIKLIEKENDDAICQIIKSVGAEYGAIGDGFGPSDPEVLAMSQYYIDQDRSAYFVVILEGKVVGGGGIAPFTASKSSNVDSDICELRKLFLLPETRGFGIGKALTKHCLAFAKSKDFKQCYLDTLASMTSAIKLYEHLNFKHLDKPIQGTIHGGCDVWMLKDL